MGRKTLERPDWTKIEHELDICAVYRLLQALNGAREDPDFWDDLTYRMDQPTCRTYLLSLYREVPGDSDLDEDMKIYSSALLEWARSRF